MLCRQCSTMEISLIALAITVLSLFTAPATTQSTTPRCLQSREDHLPCMYTNLALNRAQENQYSVHFTNIRQFNETSRDLICNVRARDQEVREITDLGTDEMRVIYSPGFINREQYKSEMRVEYQLQCGADELAFYNITFLDMQSEEDCQTEDGDNRCQDYLQVIRPFAGAVEECGTTPSKSSVLQLETGNFTVVFRTSEDDVVGGGFQMYVICFKPAEREMEGCVNALEFTSGVCAAENGAPLSPMTSETKRSVGPWWYSWRKGEPPIATFYVDLFPESGYPPNLEIPRDLAEFHHQWNRFRGKPGAILFAVDVSHNQSVNFSKKSLHLMDAEGNILTTYCIVNILQTFNSDGVIEKFVGSVKTQRNPHFRGPGILRIIKRRAYFQLFRFDSRGVVPNVEEQQEILTMNTPLLNSIFLNSSLFSEARIPRDINNPKFNESDREAVLAALRSTNSCNAVLRAQSRATLTFYSEMDPNYVECLRTFNITCSLDDGMLRCTSDSVTIPGRTLCQTDDRSPVTCDPFREALQVAELSPEASIVTVTTINCNGQTATSEVIIQEN